jgi:hypothetical protein
MASARPNQPEKTSQRASEAVSEPLSPSPGSIRSCKRSWSPFEASSPLPGP